MLRIEYLPFVVFAGLLSLCNLLPAVQMKRFGILRPVDAPIISWETPLFTLARIPFVFIGIVNGVLSVLLSRRLDFRVTPKGDRRQAPLPSRALLPYALVSILSSLAVILLAHRTFARGYYFLALTTALLLAAVVGVIVVLHHQESGWRQRRSLLKGALLFVAALSLAMTGLAMRLGQSLSVILGPFRPMAIAWNLVPPLSPDRCRSRPCFGYYDYDGTLGRQAVPSDIAHHFIPWGARHVERLRQSLEGDRSRGVQSLITLEPWPWAVLELGDPHTYKERERQANRRLLAAISAGRHDQDLLISLRTIAANGDRPVKVRLMHEMEITEIGRAHV